MLWLALSIPALPLAVFERAASTQEPFAVSAEQVLLAVNSAAASTGVAPGMRPSAARALCPQLRVRPREPQAEQEALRCLADWGLQFTSWLSIQPPNGLLLEIEGSLRLFGGLEKLLEQVRQELELIGYQGRLTIAPTAAGAWLLNRAGDERPLYDSRTLRTRLEQLPWNVLELEPRQQQALQGLGLSTLGDCLRLPRAGLGRRLGRDLLDQLDKALGLVPDPRRPHQAVPRFHTRMELPAAVEDVEPLLFALKRLLRELTGFLRGLDAGIQQLQLTLGGLKEDERQLITLGMRTATRDADHLLTLARERLARVPLERPVHRLLLTADDLQSYRPQPTDPLGDNQEESREELLERFNARLGTHAIAGLQALAEHRPERAWSYGLPGSVSSSPCSLPRPLWLLETPQPLPLREGCPYWHGPLVLKEGPERIESGWWDDGDVSRDYYIAGNPHGQRLWIFRERRGHNWYLHGFFA